MLKICLNPKTLCPGQVRQAFVLAFLVNVYGVA